MNHDGNGSGAAPYRSERLGLLARLGVLAITVHRDVVAVGGHVDACTAPIVKAALGSLVPVQGDLRVDAREVTFLGSAGLRALGEIATVLDGRGSVIILDPSPAAARAIALFGLPRAVEVIRAGSHARTHGPPSADGVTVLQPLPARSQSGGGGLS